VGWVWVFYGYGLKKRATSASHVGYRVESPRERGSWELRPNGEEEKKHLIRRKEGKGGASL